MRHLGLWLLLAIAAPAWAANPRATALARQGQQQYEAGRYKEAAELLKQAWDIDPSPVLLFNLARAYDQAGDLQTSLDTYRAFVGKPNVDPDLVKRSNLAMDRLRSLIARSDADKQVNEAEKRRLESETAAARARADAEVEKARLQKLDYEAAEQKRRDEAKQGPSNRRLAALVTGGGAVVCLAVGIGFGAAASGSKAAFLDASTLEAKRQFEAEAKGRALVADLFVGVAVAAALAAIVIFPWSGDQPGRAVSVSLVPMPGGGGASVRARF